MVTNPSSFVNSSREQSLSSTLSYPSLRRNLHLFTLSPIPRESRTGPTGCGLSNAHISDGTLFMALQYDPFRSVLLVLLPFFFSFSVDLFCRFPLVAFFTHTLYRLVFYVPLVGLKGVLELPLYVPFCFVPCFATQ